MKIQKTIELREFKQFLSENTEKLDLDIQDDLSEWLENQTNYGFTIVELGFVLDLFSIINECENMGSSIKHKWKNYISRFDLK